ncbi:hypothetical protein L226DRAFT_67080 [Lentinus tigrinus ALCF2SS1-7]|uniref:uncharacterized protein n=1 Tax=Lentinus tigrinus ALCF2SS1-7 TaxID=1328758 RepID=UPI001165FDD7|nr:hypothetical protein L226DRAFT_67080 [Lentinus tigrinus ALCF2SS1-7]
MGMLWPQLCVRGVDQRMLSTERMHGRMQQAWTWSSPCRRGRCCLRCFASKATSRDAAMAAAQEGRRRGRQAGASRRDRVYAHRTAQLGSEPAVARPWWIIRARGRRGSRSRSRREQQAPGDAVEMGAGEAILQWQVATLSSHIHDHPPSAESPPSPAALFVPVVLPISSL